MAYADPGAPDLIDRVTIRMPYLPHTLDCSAYPIVTPRSPIRLRRIAEQLGRQFRRECRYDFPPYSADDPNHTVVLLPARYALAYARLIAGAVGIEDIDGKPAATWVYLHPYERGRHLIDTAWPFIDAQWPGVQLTGPYTPAGRALAKRLHGELPGERATR